MSRETDSSSAGPQGRGGAAYPSGTPPYGSRQYPSLHPQQDAPAEASADRAPEAQSDEPRTETTLTTRIRINIPGSRPIPPVVMRTPMSDVDASTRASATAAAAEKESERTGSTPRPEAAQAPASAAEPQADEKAPTSDWFAPRKTAVPAPSPPATGGTPGAGTAGPGPSGGGTNGSGLPYFSDSPQAGQPRSALSDLAASTDSPPSGGSSGFAPGGGTPPPGARPPAG
ncbi:hypothetical protein ACFQ6Q_19780, partial [Streptomyces sp. NPDC056437]